MSTKVDFSQIKNKRLNGLDDVNAPSPSSGDALVWNAVAQKWVPGAVSGGGGQAAPAMFVISDDGEGNITVGLANTSSSLVLTDDGQGNIVLSLT